MNLKDNNRCGLIVWGTKRGKQVFFVQNLSGEPKEIDNVLNDVHTTVQVNDPNITFYGLEHNAYLTVLTIYRSIYDWLDRSGYYAVSLVLAGNMRFMKEEEILPLLRNLSELYWEKYIATNYSMPNRIIENTREDIRAFTNILNQSSYSLIQDESDRIGSYSQRCSLKYRDETHLGNIIQHYRRPELKAYGRVFILPAIERRIHCGYQTIQLNAVEHTVTLVIKVLDAVKNNAAPLSNVNYFIDKNNQGAFQKRMAIEGVVEILDLSMKDRVAITFESPGYKRIELTFSDVEWSGFFSNPVQKTVEKTVTMQLNRTMTGTVPSVTNAGYIHQTPPESDKNESQDIPISLNIHTTPENAEGNPPADPPPSVIPSTRPEPFLLRILQKIFPKSAHTAEEKEAPFDNNKSSQTGEQQLKRFSIFKILSFGTGVIFLAALLLWFIPGGKKIEFDYFKLNQEANAHLKTIASSQWKWDETSFKTMSNFFESNIQVLDSLDKLPDFKKEDLITLKQNRDQLIQARNAFNSTAKSRSNGIINTTLTGTNFELSNTNEIIDFALKMGVDTIKLRQFQFICGWITEAQNIIKGQKSNYNRLRVSSELNFILSNIKTRYAFLTTEQKNVINEYYNVILYMKDNPSIDDAKEMLHVMLIQNKIKMVRQNEIAVFLRERGLLQE